MQNENELAQPATINDVQDSWNLERDSEQLTNFVTGKLSALDAEPLFD